VVSSHTSEGSAQCVIDGVGFDAVTEEDTLQRITRALDDGEGGTVLTANVDILRQLQAPSLSKLATDAELVVADGMPVVLASRLMGNGLPERVTGSSLISSLSERVLGAGGTVALIGGAPGVVDRAAQALELENDGRGRVVYHSPEHGFESDPAEMARIERLFNRHKLDVAFIGLGFPKQELLANRLRERFPSTWFVGCGGSIAMVAGEVARAPRWAQALGLEWLFRLTQEPQRLFRRYIIHDLPYASGLLLRALGHRFSTRSRIA
jgi:N-acetylglucosaminyldiphosphoundecaprenol N-acetyl-beta-D-mannosaminyltransferase